MRSTFIPILTFFVGFFSVFCAVKDYNWFMNHRKAQFFVKLFGRNGARFFYILLGLVIMGGAVAAYFHQIILF